MVEVPPKKKLPDGTEILPDDLIRLPDGRVLLDEDLAQTGWELPERGEDARPSPPVSKSEVQVDEHGAGSDPKTPANGAARVYIGTVNYNESEEDAAEEQEPNELDRKEGENDDAWSRRIGAAQDKANKYFSETGADKDYYDQVNRINDAIGNDKKFQDSFNAYSQGISREAFENPVQHGKPQPGFDYRGVTGLSMEERISALNSTSTLPFVRYVGNDGKMYQPSDSWPAPTNDTMSYLYSQYSENERTLLNPPGDNPRDEINITNNLHPISCLRHFQKFPEPAPRSILNYSAVILLRRSRKPQKQN